MEDKCILRQQKSPKQTKRRTGVGSVVFVALLLILAFRGLVLIRKPLLSLCSWELSLSVRWEIVQITPVM